MSDFFPKREGGLPERATTPAAPPIASTVARPRRKFCTRHSSHFCPCVYPSIYRKGDERGDPAYWDRVQAEARAKKEAKKNGV